MSVFDRILFNANPQSVVREGEFDFDPSSVLREGEGLQYDVEVDGKPEQFSFDNMLTKDGMNVLRENEGITPLPILKEGEETVIVIDRREGSKTFGMPIGVPRNMETYKLIRSGELDEITREIMDRAEGSPMEGEMNAVGIADGLDQETPTSDPMSDGIAKVSPEQYVQLMNEIRGDEVPMEGRVQELAMTVGEKDAQDTPLSVLALVQPVFELQEQEGIGATQEAQAMPQQMMPTAADQLANPQNMGIVRANTGLFVNSTDPVSYPGQDMSMFLNTPASSQKNNILDNMMSPSQYDFITRMGENMFGMGKPPIDITQRAKEYEEKLLDNADLKNQFLSSVVSPLLLKTATDILDPEKSFSEVMMGGLTNISAAGAAGTKLKQPYKTQALNLATKDKEIQDTNQSDFVKLFGAEAIKKAFAEQKEKEIVFQTVNGVPIPFDKSTGQPISSQEIYYTSLTNAKMEQINKGLKLETAQSVKNLFPDLTEEELIQINQDPDYFVKNSPRFKEDFYDTDEGMKFKMTQEDTLRKEYLAQTKDFASAVRQFSILDTIADDSTGATDMALVFTYMKILDPTSVVRDSEFGLAASTDLSTFEGITMNTINKIFNGQTVLTSKQRATLISAARGATLGAYRAYEGVRGGFEDIVEVRGLEPISVLPDFTQGLKLPTVDDFDSLPKSEQFDYYEELSSIFDLPIDQRGTEFFNDNEQDFIDKVNK